MANLIGSDANQVPTNGMLGRLAFQNPDAVVLEPKASATPAKPGDMVFQLTSNTALAVKVMGIDGTVRTAVLTLS